MKRKKFSQSHLQDLKHSDWTCTELEARLMLAGDAATAADGSAAAQMVGAPASESLAAEIGSTLANAAASQMSVASHLVIVDSTIAGDSDWLSAVPENADFVVLNEGHDPLAQIDRILQDRAGLQSVHLLCHGRDGEIQLGNLQLNDQVLEERADEIQRWGEAFAEGGDLLIYGCNVAESDHGSQFLRQLALLTGVDVAASTDQTGSPTAKQGDWDLEWQHGKINHAQLLAADALNRFRGHLAIDGAGLSLNGSASILDDELQLTSNTAQQAGSAFLQNSFAIDSSTSFQSAFSFRMGGGGSKGADGMAFLIQNDSDGANALGGAGGYLGYDTIDPSLAIEFDTHQNAGDISGNSIAIVLNGETQNALTEAAAPFELNDGSEYFAWVDYDGNSDTLSVFVSETDNKPAEALLTAQVALDEIVGDSAYAGFSAGNFNNPDFHRVTSWDFSLQAGASSAGVGVANDDTSAPTGLVGHWMLEETAIGQTVVDSSGNGNNGVHVNITSPDGPSSDAVVGSRSLSIDGVDDYVSIAPDASLDLSGGQFTQSVWIRPEITDDGYHGILGYQGFEVAERYPSLWVTQETKIHAGFGDGTEWNSLFTGDVLTPFEWNHVVATFDGNEYTIYVDAVEVFSTLSMSGKTPFSTQQLDIGRVDNQFDGLIDDVRIYDRALDASEVSQLFVVGGGSAAGVIQLADSAYTVLESDGSVDVELVRVGGSEGVATVNYATGDDSATAPSDYTGTSGVVTFQDGQVSQIVTILISDDGNVEADESFSISLSNASGATLGTLRDGVVTINDDDTATTTLTVSIEAAAIGEGDGPAATTATVTRDGDLSSDLNVSLASNDTSEATVPSSVTILAGQASATFDIDAVDDSTDDSTQTVTITASAAGAQSGSDTINVLDDDTSAPTGLVGHWMLEETFIGQTVVDSSGNGNNGVHVNITSPDGPNADAAIGSRSLSTDGVDDYVAIAPDASLDLSNGQFTQSVWIRPEITDDGYHGILGYQGFEVAERYPSLWVTQGTRIHAGFGDGTEWNSLFTDEVLTPFEWNHVVATFDGNEYNIYVDGVEVFSTLSMSGKTPFSTQQLDIGRVDNQFDGLIDDVRIYDRALDASEVSQLYVSGSSNPGVIQLATSAYTVLESDGVVEIELVRVGGSDGVVTVNYATEDDSASASSDYTGASGVATFQDGQTSQIISISINDDGNIESNERFSFSLSDASVATLGYPRDSVVTITDDDTQLPSFDSFPSASGLNLNGSASIEGDELQLTGTGVQQAGSAFFESPIAVDSSSSFQSSFSFRIGGGAGAVGADGFAFLLQNSPAGTDALGGAGGYLGYDTIGQSLAIEFDTYQNGGDSSDNEIAVVINGDVFNAVADAPAAFDLNDGTQYYAWVEYNGDTNLLEVYLSSSDTKPGTPALTTEIDLEQIVGSMAYAGFSAGNYNSPNFHRISSWSLTQDAPPASPGSFALATSLVTVSEGENFITLGVERLGGSAGAASVDYLTVGDSALPGQDFLSDSGTLFFADGETSKQFTIPILGDDIAEPTEQFSVRIDNPQGADLLAPRTTLVTILDDDSGLPIFPSFNSDFGLNLNGSASIVSDELQLTSTGVQQAGSAFFETPVTIDSSTSFRSSFSFRIGEGAGSAGADGMTFLLQNSAAGADALGQAGGYLGYDTIGQSLAIEFDTYQNAGDLSGNSLAVVINGDTPNAVAEAPAIFDLNNGNQYYAWVEYNGDSNVLAVYLSESPDKPLFALMKTEVELADIVGDSAYVGFSAGNFNDPNSHVVSSWNFSLDVPAADPPLNASGEIVEDNLYTGLVQPLAIDWSPDGRNLYVAEKAGIVKVARDGATGLTQVLDISDQVNNVQDRGLLDIAVHPDFENNGYLYLLYTYDPPEVFDNTGDPNARPDGQGNRAGRLMRVTLDASTGFTTMVANSETILLGTNSTWDNFNAFVDSTNDFSEPQAGYDPVNGYLQDFINSDSRSHTVGSLAFGTDGNLFVSIGDGASFNQTDVRALRVQDIDSLSGKVLRIDPLTGEGVSDNPFYNGDPDANRSKVYQLGLRNPWRLTVDRVTNQLVIGETGLSSYEEINSGEAGANFGWPFYEGAQGANARTPSYRDLPQAGAFYADNDALPPEIALKHLDGSDVVVVGDITYNLDLGIQYDGDLFYNDMYRGIVRHANIDEDGNIVDAQTFVGGAQFVVDIQQGPDNSLYYVNLVEGTVGKWRIV